MKAAAAGRPRHAHALQPRLFRRPAGVLFRPFSCDDAPTTIPASRRGRPQRIFGCSSHRLRQSRGRDSQGGRLSFPGPLNISSYTPRRPLIYICSGTSTKDKGQRLSRINGKLAAKTRYPFIDIFEWLKIGEMHHKKKCLLKWIFYCICCINDLLKTFADQLRHRKR